MNYPQNEEHLEAVQADVNDYRAKRKGLLSEEDRARLELIEECVGKLEKARIPFSLWAAHDTTKEDTGRVDSWWIFHKLAYSNKGYEDLKKKTWESWNEGYFSRLLCHESLMCPGSIVVFNEETKQPLFGYYQGAPLVMDQPKE